MIYPIATSASHSTVKIRWAQLILNLPNHFVLPIANPFLSCPVAFYINRSSNKRSLLNKRTINYLFII